MNAPAAAAAAAAPAVGPVGPHRITDLENASDFLRKNAQKLTKSDKKPFLLNMINGNPALVPFLTIGQLQTQLRNYFSDVQSREVTGGKVHALLTSLLNNTQFGDDNILTIMFNMVESHDAIAPDGTPIYPREFNEFLHRAHRAYIFSLSPGSNWKTPLLPGDIPRIESLAAVITNYIIIYANAWKTVAALETGQRVRQKNGVPYKTRWQETAGYTEAPFIGTNFSRYRLCVPLPPADFNVP